MKPFLQKPWITLLVLLPSIFGTIKGQAPSTSTEENAVYAVILEQARSEYYNARDVVLLSTTYTRKDIVDSYDGRKHKELLAEFNLANSAIVRIGDIPTTDYHLVNESDAMKLFAEGDTLYKQAVANRKPHEMILGTEYWMPFYRKYPEAHGFYKLSRVGFNQKKTLALVNVTFESNSAGFSRMYLLNRRKGAWFIRESSGEESIS